MNVRMKGEDGVYIRGNEERRMEVTECIMNDKTEGEAIVSSMGMEAGEKRVCVCVYAERKQRKQ